jgi:hypothetical protein
VPRIHGEGGKRRPRTPRPSRSGSTKTTHSGHPAPAASRGTASRTSSASTTQALALMLHRAHSSQWVQGAQARAQVAGGGPHRTPFPRKIRGAQRYCRPSPPNRPRPRPHRGTMQHPHRTPHPGTPSMPAIAARRGRRIPQRTLLTLTERLLAHQPAKACMSRGRAGGSPAATNARLRLWKWAGRARTTSPAAVRSSRPPSALGGPGAVPGARPARLGGICRPCAPHRCVSCPQEVRPSPPPPTLRQPATHAHTCIVPARFPHSPHPTPCPPNRRHTQRHTRSPSHSSRTVPRLGAPRGWRTHAHTYKHMPTRTSTCTQPCTARCTERPSCALSSALRGCAPGAGSQRGGSLRAGTGSQQRRHHGLHIPGHIRRGADVGGGGEGQQPLGVLRGQLYAGNKGGQAGLVHCHAAGKVPAWV